jgi:hypothetical protein
MVAQELSPREPISPSALVPELVYEALMRTLGRDRAEVVDFYIDTRLAAEDPERYERAIKSLLGEHGARLVTRAIKSELAKPGRVENGRDESLLTEVRTVEKALLRSAHLV